MSEFNGSIIVTGNDVSMAEFGEIIRKKVAKTILTETSFDGFLFDYVKEAVPFGAEIESIKFDMPDTEDFDPTSTNVFERNIPTAKNSLTIRNVTKRLPITINVAQLKSGMRSADDEARLIGAILNACQLGMDLFFHNVHLSLCTLNTALDPDTNIFGKVRYGYDEGSTVDDRKAMLLSLIKDIKKDIISFKNPNADFNKAEQLTANKNAKDFLLVLSKDVEVDLIDVLGNMYHKELADWGINKKVVDKWDTEVTAHAEQLACLIDTTGLRLHNQLLETTSIQNPRNLDTNYVFHKWDFIGFDGHANAVCYTMEEEPSSED